MNTFIFDLDGTLLPMPSQEMFLDTYMNALSKKIQTQGLAPQAIVKAVWTSTGSMLNNDGTKTNEQRFWESFSNLVGEGAMDLEPVFESFYRNEFIEAKATTYHQPLATKCISLLKEKGYQVVLATNPLFPQIATYTRMEWAGLNPEDFERITTYENSSFCKPNLEYYTEILNQIHKSPEECIMIGNDVKEDMCAAKLGMDTFLLKDCLICSEGEDLSRYQQGDFNDLYSFIEQLPSLKVMN